MTSLIPRLTREEAAVAKRRAFEYPPGHGSVWGVDLDETPDWSEYCSPDQADDAAYFFELYPSYLHAGRPAVAVAQFRGDITQHGLQKALNDLAFTLALDHNQYCNLLDEDPHAIAQRIEKIESFLED